MQQLLNKLVNEHQECAKEGKVADYIPALAAADPNVLGATIIKGCEVFSAGEWEYNFTIQSISKVFTLMLALQDNGSEKVFEKVGMEPTGDPYNSIIKLEVTDSAKPLNPMINAGALAVTSMIKGENQHEKFARILDFIRTIAANQEISYNEDVYNSEWETGDRNRALAYFLREMKIIDGDVEDILDLYFKQCSIEVNTEDLARMGSFLANQGWLKGEDQKEDLMAREITRIAKTFMVTCGMYDASGEFAIKVGIPAKSGVSGGILALVPNRDIGIGIVGPALDKKGNSICGVNLLESLSKELNLSIF